MEIKLKDKMGKVFPVLWANFKLFIKIIVEIELIIFVVALMNFGTHVDFYSDANSTICFLMCLDCVIIMVMFEWLFEWQHKLKKDKLTFRWLAFIMNFLLSCCTVLGILCLAILLWVNFNLAFTEVYFAFAIALILFAIYRICLKANKAYNSQEKN